MWPQKPDRQHEHRKHQGGYDNAHSTRNTSRETAKLHTKRTRQE